MTSVHEPQLLLDLYRTMLRIRLAEEALVEPIVAGEIRCPVHLYSGEEAVAAGVCSVLEPGDLVFGTHRSHGHYLAKGGDLKRMIAEIFCRDSGCARGRGGSMHLIDVEVGMLGAAPIVGGTISLAVGAGLAAAVRGGGRVSVAFFGDGATGEGVLYESMNLAAVHRLPVLFVCENNLYATHMPLREIRASEEIWPVAQPFGVPGARVDGNDVLAVRVAAAEAVARARAGQGPALLECLTYRMRGHVGPDDNIQGSRTDIRPAAEVELWRTRDPLARLAATLRDAGIAGDATLCAMQQEVAEEIKGAFAYARSTPFPPPEGLADNVIA